MVDLEEMLSWKNIDTIWNAFVNKLKEVMSSFASRASRRGNKGKCLPWLDQNCRDLLNLRDEVLKQYLKSGLSTDRLKFAQAHNKVIQTIRKPKANFSVSIIESAKGNGKKNMAHIKLTTR